MASALSKRRGDGPPGLGDRIFAGMQLLLMGVVWLVALVPFTILFVVILGLKSIGLDRALAKRSASDRA